MATEEASAPTSADKSKILQQVEFYFSDSNLLNDKFLFTTQAANEGWVPISLISQFQRMKKYRPIDQIVDALRESKDLLEVSEDGELVRRKAPLPENQNQIQVAIAKRSVVAEPFPPDVTLDALLDFFNQIAPTNQVRMRRKKREFTGAVIVEFKDAADAAKLLEAEEKPKYDGVELKIISKSAYDESKAQAFGKRRGSTGRGRKVKMQKREKKDGEDEEPVAEEPVADKSEVTEVTEATEATETETKETAAKAAAKEESAIEA